MTNPLKVLTLLIYTGSDRPPRLHKWAKRLGWKRLRAKLKKEIDIWGK